MESDRDAIPEPTHSKWDSLPVIIVKSVGIAAILTGLAWAGVSLAFKYF